PEVGRRGREEKREKGKREGKREKKREKKGKKEKITSGRPGAAGGPEVGCRRRGWVAGGGRVAGGGKIAGDGEDFG
ncbi:hypothetical protein TIFTF001_055647, partial [Ficus carica]